MGPFRQDPLLGKIGVAVCPRWYAVPRGQRALAGRVSTFGSQPARFARVSVSRDPTGTRMDTPTPSTQGKEPDARSFARAEAVVRRIVAERHDRRSLGSRIAC